MLFKSAVFNKYDSEKMHSGGIIQQTYNSYKDITGTVTGHQVLRWLVIVLESPDSQFPPDQPLKGRHFLPKTITPSLARRQAR